ncbi:MAG: hypothetical protein AseanaTS_13960 [Candidatus Pelagadaptatus aseana]
MQQSEVGDHAAFVIAVGAVQQLICTGLLDIAGDLPLQKFGGVGALDSEQSKMFELADAKRLIISHIESGLDLAVQFALVSRRL